MKKAFPQRWLAELQRPFGDQWVEMAASSIRAKATGQVDAVSADEFDYLGVERFYSLADVHFRLLFPSVAAMPDEQRIPIRSSILRWIKQVKDVRNPMSHPVDSDFSYADAFTTMD